MPFGDSAIVMLLFLMLLLIFFVVLLVNKFSLKAIGLLLTSGGRTHPKKIIIEKDQLPSAFSIPNTKLPPPGEFISTELPQNEFSAKRSVNGNSLRVVSWNLDRGKELPQIINALRELNADIILLQELDINCKRTHWVNVAHRIARELNFARVIFATEFIELVHPCRSSSKQAGGGVQGNAILLRFKELRPILTLTFLHLHQPFDWVSI